MSRSARRHRIVAGAVLVLVVGAATTWWVAQREPTGEATLPATADPAVDVQEVSALIQRLPAAFAAGDTGVLSSVAKSRHLDLAHALPPGAVLAADAGTWRRTGIVGSTTVTVTVAGQAPAQFVVVVVREDGTWKVSSTFPVEAA